MKYVTTMEHDDFILVLETLRKAKENGIVSWNAAGVLCNNTKVEE